ncbi:MAG: hypothetical protein J6V48_02645 [Clostridia bacterium]|nr:hypothetical protein [Clostridia bacterium]
MKKITSLIMSVLALCAVLAGCGSTVEEIITTGPETTVPELSVPETEAVTVDAEGYLLDDLPPLDFDGKKITVLYDTGVLNQDFFAEEQNGSAVNDALLARNAAVEDRLRIKFDFIPEIGDHNNHEVYVTKVRSDLGSGTPEFMIYGATSRTVALIAAEGSCVNLLKTKYFNREKPWWPRALTDEVTSHGKLFFCTGDISTNAIWMMSSIIFNDELLKEQHLESPLYDTVLQGEWTLDRFCEIVSAAVVLNGSGAVDIYGLVGYNACFDAMLNANGIISIVKNGDGDFVFSDDFLGERTQTVVEKMGKLFTATPAVHQSGTANNERKIFYDGKSLFMIDGIYTVVSGQAAGMSFSYGVVPCPKFDKDQANYVTNMRYQYNLFAISSGFDGETSDVCSAALEALASDSYRHLTPVLFEETMKARYSKDIVTAQMFDILRENICFDVGRIHNYSLTNFYPDFRSACFNGGTSWSSTVKKYVKQVGLELEKLNAFYRAD